jgi:FkbM family methyltransferase
VTASRLKTRLIPFLYLPPDQLREHHPRLARVCDGLDSVLPVRQLLQFVYRQRARVRSGAFGAVESATVLHGVRLRFIDTGRYDYHHHLSRGLAHEPALTRYLTELFQTLEAPTFVDVGAHFGFFTVYAGLALRGRGRVIGVEPNGLFHTHLQRNVALNGLADDVRTFQVAFGARTGRGRMRGWDDRVLAEDAEGQVEIVTFDDFCERRAIRPDIVKIDVHGSEGRILAGMTRVLQRDVRHVFCELHTDMLGYSARDLVGMLTDAGLEVSEFTRHRDEDGGRIVPIGDAFLTGPADRVLYGHRPGPSSSPVRPAR